MKERSYVAKLLISDQKLVIKIELTSLSQTAKQEYAPVWVAHEL